MGQDARQLVPAFVLGAAVALTAALGSLLYMERANVKVWISSQRLEAHATIHGGLNGYDLATMRLDGNITESQKVSTSQVPIAATYATGQVVFTCSPACPGGYTVPAGAVVATTKGVQYQTQALVTIPAAGPTPPVAVRAAAGGLSGNTGSSTITVLVSHLPSNLHVTNPKPAAGGVDTVQPGVVAQADYDSVRQALTEKVSTDLAADLKTRAKGLVYVTGEDPVVTSSSDFNVGDKTPAFTMIVTGRLQAIAFAKSDVNQLLRDALNQRIPAGYQLTSDAVRTRYRIEAASTSSGTVTITGMAVGYVMPKVSTPTLTAQLRGMSLVDARNRLQHSVPGGAVEIRVTPVSLPWLPVIANHIVLDGVLERNSDLVE